MVQYFPVITGSLTVNGNLSVSGNVAVTGSMSGTSSLAANAELLSGTGSVGFTTTGSFTVASSSLSSRTTQIESVYATTGSNSFRATQSITGSLTVTGQIIAQTINVQQVTSSIVFSSGSNTFGCDLNSRQTFTGSVLMTGSLIVNTTGPELQVNNNGVTIGNLQTDNHSITGSLRITGSLTSFSGCVGIGGVIPTRLLDVNGVIRTRDAGSAGAPSIELGTSAQGNGLFYPTTNTIAITTNDTERMRITSAGIACFACQVCVPQLRLTGSANIILQPSFVGSSNLRSGGAIQYSKNFTIFTDDGVNGCGFDLQYWNGSAYYPGLRLNNVSSGFASLLLLQDGGNVGIGTSNPQVLLHIVKGSGSPRFDISTTDSYSTACSLYLAQSGNYSTIEAYNYAANIGMNLSLNPSGGKVGINTSTPYGSMDRVRGVSGIQLPTSGLAALHFASAKNGSSVPQCGPILSVNGNSLGYTTFSIHLFGNATLLNGSGQSSVLSTYDMISFVKDNFGSQFCISRISSVLNNKGAGDPLLTLIGSVSSNVFTLCAAVPASGQSSYNVTGYMLTGQQGGNAGSQILTVYDGSTTSIYCS